MAIWIVFASLGLMVLAWFAMISSLCSRLEQKHPNTYRALGQPNIFSRNNPATATATIRFSVQRQHRVLADSHLSALSDFMLTFLAAYLVLLSAFVALVVTHG